MLRYETSKRPVDFVDFDKTTVICVKVFLDIACQKLLKSANVLRIYSQIKVSHLYGLRCVCFM